MAQDRQLENLIREARMRRGIILYGNTRDEHLIAPINPKGETKYGLLPDYVTTSLSKAGFEVVGKWDRHNGFRIDDEKGRRLFTRWSRPEQEKLEGVAYDAGDDVPTEDVIPTLKDFNEVVSSIDIALDRHDRPCAFVLDWTDFQFSTVQRPLAEDDRLSLEHLSRLMCGKGTGSMKKVASEPPGVVIMITANLGAIPPLLYQPDSRVKLFNMTNPEKGTRITFFENHLESLNLKNIGEKSRKEIIDELADMTDGLRTADLIQMVRLGRDHKDLTPERLLNLYRFGEKRSPWEELSSDKLTKAEETLKKRVVGQDEAVQHVANTIIKASMGLSGIQHSSRLTKPKGVMFFVGPTGVGKTELAKATAELLFGDENACIRFDMSEFSHEESDQRLIGAPPGYVGFEEGGQLTNAVLERPFSVLLFDEIEKAHPRILDKFLQVLEDGRLTDGKGVTAFFSESVIIFTSNIGASDVGKGPSSTKETIQRDFREKVKNHFNDVLKRPELLNRIGDNIVVFQPIENGDLRRQIIKRKMRPLIETVQAKHDVGLVIDDKAIAFVEQNADMSHGGRGLLNAVERLLINPLSTFMFKNRPALTKGRIIVALIDPGSNQIGFVIRDE